MCFVTVKHFKLTNNETLLRNGYLLLQTTTAKQPLKTWPALCPLPTPGSAPEYVGVAHQITSPDITETKEALHEIYSKHFHKVNTEF